MAGRLLATVVVRGASAEPQGMQMPPVMNSETIIGCQCPMSGMHGVAALIAMTLGGLFALAAIAVLVALTLFLIRRSRPVTSTST